MCRPRQACRADCRSKTHIRSRGDMNFTDAPWAGRVAPGLWIESFSVLPLEQLAVYDIEYKGLTGTGFETPWLSDDQNCGTKGMSVPLVGFAMRLKPSPETRPTTANTPATISPASPWARCETVRRAARRSPTIRLRVFRFASSSAPRRPPARLRRIAWLRGPRRAVPRARRPRSAAIGMRMTPRRRAVAKAAQTAAKAVKRGKPDDTSGKTGAGLRPAQRLPTRN